MSKKKLSTIIAVTTVLIAIVIIAGLIFVVFCGGSLNIQGGNSPLATITPSIYSTKNNIAVLNENATFTIHATNPTTDELGFLVLMTVDGNLVDNYTFTVAPNVGTNQLLTQKISYTGNWLITVSSTQQKNLDTYSFVAYSNPIDADLHINPVYGENSASSEKVKFL